MLPNPMQTPPIGGMAPMNTTPPMNMMPPMPPMGKMPPMEMNLDPMARQNFNNLMSGIQSQSIIPPMPMRMNEGGSVNPLMALIQGIGRLLGFGGGQEPSRVMSFGDAFAKARREGKKVFEYNGKMYTTEIKEEEDARIAQEEEDSRKARRYTGPTIPAMQDPYDEVMASTPTMGDEFDVQNQSGKSSNLDGITEDIERLRGRVNNLFRMAEAEGQPPFTSTKARFTGFDPKVPPGGKPVPPQVRQGDEFLVAAAADAPNVEGKTISSDDVQKINDLTASINANLGGANRVDPIEAQLNALMNISPGSVRETTTKPDVLTEGIAPLSFKEQLRSLLQGLNNMGLSNQLSSSINDKLDQLSGLTSSRSRRDVREALGMTEGGNPMVEKLKSIILQSSNPQEKLQEMFTTFKEAEANDEDVSQLLEAVGIIQQSPEFMKDATRSSLIGTMPLQIKERVSDNTKNVEEEFDDVPLIMKEVIEMAIKNAQKGIGMREGGSVTDAIAKLEKGGDAESMLFKNQGGVVPIQGFTNGGPPTENVKPFFDKDNIFESTLDKLNQTFGPADTGAGGQYASAKDQAAAENKGKSFFGATSYSYPIGDNILRLSTPTSTGNPFGDDSNPAYSAGRYGGPKGSPAPKPDIANMTQEEAQAYITTMAPTTKGYTGDYSDLDTFKSYTFYDPNFQFEDFKQAAEIAGYGKKNKLASDTNIASGAAEGTYRQEGEDVVDDDDDDVVDDTNLGTDTGTTMTSTATTPISPFAQIEQETVVPSTRTVDASFNPSFTPLASTDIYNPNFLTDMPDFSTLSIDPSQSAAVDLQKFLDIDEDKTAPKAFTPDTTNITDIMKASGYQQGGAVSPGLNMAIDKFISAYS